MTDIASTLFALAIIASAPINIPNEEITPRFKTACTNGRWEANCPALRNKLEVLLYTRMHELFQLGEPLDREQLRVAARGRFAYLAHFALARLESLQGPEDKDVVVAALEHPSPAVRIKAKTILDRSGDAWREGPRRWWKGDNAEMAPDLMPDMARYGVPALQDPQLRYRFSASGSRRAVYTTKLSPEKVLDLIAKGKPVVTGDKLGNASGRTTPQQALVDQQKEFITMSKQIQEAAARGDYKTMQALGERMKALQGGIKQSAKEMQDTTGMEPVTAFSVEPSQVRYVNLGDRRGRRLIAAVGQDDAWGETVVVVTLPH